MKTAQSLFLFLSLGLLGTVSARAERFLPAGVPSQVSVLIFGPAEKPWNSRFGHIDLVLSYKKTLMSNDLVISFGPPGGAITLRKAMGWDEPYPMHVFKSTLRERFQYALQTQRPWVQVLTFKFNEAERQRFLQNLEKTVSQVKKGEIFYLALKYNCATIVADAVALAKGQELTSGRRHRPLLAEALYAKELGWVDRDQKFPQALIQELVSRSHR